MIWWYSRKWAIESSLDRDRCQMLAIDFVETRKQRRRWPFLLGNPLKLTNNGFAIPPDRLMRNPWAVTISGDIWERDGGSTIAIAIRLGFGSVVEAIVICASALLAVISSVIIISSMNRHTWSSSDFALILLIVPLITVVGVGFTARMWIQFRARQFVREMGRHLEMNAAHRPK